MKKLFIRVEGFNTPPFRALKKGIKPRIQIPYKNNIHRPFRARLLILLFLLAISSNAFSFNQGNLWHLHPEIADVNSMFFEVGVSFVFKDIEFVYFPLNLRFDYMLPFVLPISAGIFMDTPYPNLKHFGTRIAFHINIDNPLTDIYILHAFDFGFIRNPLLEKYNDTPVVARFFDFRVGVRRFFGQRIGLAIETGYHFESVILSLSIKIN